MTVGAVMPTPEERHVLANLADLVARHSPTGLAIRSSGVEVDLPRSIRSVLERVAELLAAGRGVAIVPVDAELSTREAADLLGVSRPTLIKLLEAGEIGFSRPNSSRRIPLEEVLAYKHRRSTKRRTLLAKMTAESVEMGNYGAPSDVDDGT